MDDKHRPETPSSARSRHRPKPRPQHPHRPRGTPRVATHAPTDGRPQSAAHTSVSGHLPAVKIATAAPTPSSASMRRPMAAAAATSSWPSRRRGRRVIIVFPHYSMAHAAPANVHRFSDPISIVAAPFHYTDRARSYRGLHARRGMAYIRASGRDLGPAARDVRDLPQAAAARRGRRHRLRHRGQPADALLGPHGALASGPARLAHDADAVVVVSHGAPSAGGLRSGSQTPETLLRRVSWRRR